MLSRVSSGYGSDFQSPTAEKESTKWPKQDVQSSPADSALAISPYMNIYTPASHMANAPYSAGYSSGICTDAGTPDIKSPSENTNTYTHGDRSILMFLRKNFVILKDDLEPSIVADHLYSDGVISSKDIETIREEPHRRKRCDSLIKAIANSKCLSDKSTPLKLQQAMKSAKCGHLVSDLMKEEPHIVDDIQTETDPIKNIDIKSQLHSYGDKLKEEVDPRLIIDDLVVSGVLSFNDHTYIASTINREDAVVNLIRCVLKRPDKSFGPFCAALGEQYSDIAKLLQNHNTNASSGRTESTLVLTTTLREGESTTSWCDKKETITKSTQVKIQIGANYKDVEQMVVEENMDTPNETLVEEAMDVGGFEIDDIHFSSIVIDLTSMSCHSQLRLLQQIHDSPSYMEKWLACLLSQKCLERLAMVDAKSISIEISAKWPNCSKLPCHCKLTKETIVKHFTLIEKELKHVCTIVDAFAKCPAFDDETKEYFKTCLGLNETGSTKNEIFLRKVLNCKKTVCLCLLESQLHETDQTPLLKQVTTADQQRTAETRKIRDRHIRMNMNYLLEEVEPSLFLDELRLFSSNTDALIETIMLKEKRQERCREFLQFVVKGGTRATNWFVDVLQKKNMIMILQMLQSSLAEEVHEDYAEGIISNYKRVVDGVDARTLRQTFVDRREIKAKDFDRIMKHASRRSKIVWLVKHILNSQKSVRRCFVDALEINGYAELATAIRNEKDLHRECPRLSKLLNRGNEVAIKATFDIEIGKRTTKESPLQISLHRSLFSSKVQSSEESVDKNESTVRWLETQGVIAGVSADDVQVNEIPFTDDADVSSCKSPASTVNYSYGMDDGYHTCSAVDTPESSFQYEDISPASTPDPATPHAHCFTPGSGVKTIAHYENIASPSSPVTNTATMPACSDHMVPQADKVALTACSNRPIVESSVRCRKYVNI